jgi:hypothetical protein
MHRQTLAALALTGALLLSGCGPTDTTPGAGEQGDYNITTLDVSDGALGLLDLETGRKLTDANSGDWYFGYQKMRGFRTNKKGGVTSCLAKEYTQLYKDGKPVVAEFNKLNADNTRADFEKITAADCNDSDFKPDSIKTFITRQEWLGLNPATMTFYAKTDPSNLWIIRSADGKAYARVKVKTVDVNMSAHTRKITLASELYDADAKSFGAERTSPELDFSTGPAYWDLETNDLTSAESTNHVWDMAIRKVGRDYLLQTNGGASGNGHGGVGLISKAFKAAGKNESNVTDPTNPEQIFTYFTDRFDGPMVGHPGDYGPYEFRADPTDPSMYPTYAIYILKKGEKKFKVQILSYYGEDGKQSSGHMVVRYKELTD